jgi:CheY-like chemotaxis protein
MDPAAAVQNPKKVLIVDDEGLIASTLAEILSRAGFTTMAAFSGEEAVEKAAGFGPDFVVMDVLLPGIDGVEAAARILRSYPQCKLLFLSGHADPVEVTHRARALGMECDMLAKPLLPADLIDRINSILNPRRPGSALVLNVDDHDLHRYAITRLLSDAGFDVQEAKNGEEALWAAITAHPDVILLDVNLPDMSGFDVCSRLKALPKTSAIPVVFVTGTFDDETSRAKAFGLGAVEYLVYPVDPRALCTLLARLTARGAAATP